MSSFVIKVRGAKTPTIAAEYYCEKHGRFELDVERTVAGDAPDTVPCPMSGFQNDGSDCCEDCVGQCDLPATWCISAPLARVQKVTAVTKGKWQKPEHKTWTDTRNIAEGQPLYEWKEDRAKIWEERRKEDVVRFAREHNERVIGGD